MISRAVVDIAVPSPGIMSTMKLYAHPQSPPSRTVTLALDVLKVEHEYKFVDLFAGEARKPEYLKVDKIEPCAPLRAFGVVVFVAVAVFVCSYY